MNTNLYSAILDTKCNGFAPGEYDFKLLSEYKHIIEEPAYFDFIIESSNGGFFFKQALHLYGFSDKYDFHDIRGINALLQQEYGKIVDGLIAFGQELFANQFCFDVKTKEIIFFSVESGEREIIAPSFRDWCKLIVTDLEYFTGINVSTQWVNDKGNLQLDQRLYPRKPFIIGGEYKVENLIAGQFPDYIKANANIARQIFNLPDGTAIKLKFINPE